MSSKFFPTRLMLQLGDREEEDSSVLPCLQYLVRWTDPLRMFQENRETSAHGKD